jgi:UDPglucose 6-dehydrogenase
MKIAVAGMGYVGLSNAVLLARNHEVTAVDIYRPRVDMLNPRKKPIIEGALKKFYPVKKKNNRLFRRPNGL